MARKNNYSSEANYILKPHLLFSLLSDFNMYMGDSLRSIEEGRVSVAFATSRKPIHDTFFYLCWLLSSGDDLLNKIQYSNKAKDYDISEFKRGKSDFIITTLSNAIDEVICPWNGKELYELLYTKDKSDLASVWNKSLHIITNDKNHTTNPKNLNFVFANNDIWNNLWGYYYSVFLHIYHIAMRVAIKIFQDIFKISENYRVINQVILDIKYLEIIGIEDDDIKSAYKYILEHTEFYCDKCASIYNNQFLLEEILTKNLFACQHCGHMERVGNYIIDDPEIEKIINNRRIII
ncbi:hypothetical protein [Aerococcus kribbianus]|uniref:Uncharacterized protein n=1 Tax=Aerococcus kribbianus TaxID=2999064 RepID=A0A9X3FLZ6_9LACT|nr:MULTISPECIES: hypothetical protein [unclassified Aerococcus]MCZ0716815.1 hypothetical protein [Aerococcus sp. YH-aer221]MCZ0725103.1 hypothetical protein [Aerococcus sp. YH-aer222]